MRPAIPRDPAYIKERSSVDPATKCWIWKNRIGADGYGQASACGTTVRAHRLSHHIFLGDPEGAQVLHKCDVRACVNPKHLFLGSHKQNMEDMTNKNRQCRGTQTNTAKLTAAKVRKIRATPRTSRGAGTNTALAKKYGVTDVLISYIRAGKCWKHVK